MAFGKETEMKTSQSKRILSHLQKGKSLNPLQALHLFGCFRLASRISELRNSGFRIATKFVTKNKKTYAEYYYNPLIEKNYE